MKVKIAKYKYEKIEEEAQIVELPQEPLFLFEFGHRIHHAIIPMWTTWNMEVRNEPEYIYEYSVISVKNSFNCFIEINSFKPEKSFISLEWHYYAKKEDIVSRVVRMLVDGYEKRCIRTKEQFLSDYNAVCEKITEFLV